MDEIIITTPAIEYHTNVQIGTRNGIYIGPRWLNGKCHEAWRVFDENVKFEDEGMSLPATKEVVAVGVALGLNKGNLTIEYPRWKKYNGFHR